MCLLGVASLSAQAGEPAPTGEDDPALKAMIFRAFPEGLSYSRIVRDVGADARAEVERRLPFKVHFDELGPHTLFVAFRAKRPIGLVYLRSEVAEWGLVDIAWALDLDLRVVRFQFLRGRHRHLEGLANSPFARDLVGRDFAGVSGLLRDGASVHVQEGAKELANTVLRSCAKALLVTDTVWREEVEKLQDQAIGFGAFPAAVRLSRLSGKFDLAAGDVQQHVVVKVIDAHGAGTDRLGAVVHTETQLDGRDVELRWVLDPDRTITQLTATHVTESTQWSLAFAGLKGRRLSELPDDGNPLLPLAQGLGALLTELAAGRRSR